MNIEKIKEARRELHKIVQLVGAVPRSLLAPDPSDSSASLIWDHELRALCCQEVGSVKVGLQIDSFKLIIKSSDHIQDLFVINKSYEELLAELRDSISDLGLEGAKINTELPYELPESLSVIGNPFIEPDKEALQSISNLYHLTHKILIATFGENKSASEIRCWPHHFDSATLLTIKEHEDPEEAKSIGFGFSPGDDGYTEPYFYITPWPYPKLDKLYELDEPAIWNTEGCIGAVLKANDLTSKTLEDSLTSFFNNGLTKLTPLL